MLLIQDRIVSLSLLDQYFVCNLSRCKGGCCVHGDYGAPLEAEEIAYLEEHVHLISPFLTKAGNDLISEEGVQQYFSQPGFRGTPLLADGACAFAIFDHSGTAKCGIEAAHEAGAINFRKPVSCHLYPVRVETDQALSFEALNYNEWDICSPACSLGKELRIPLYRFVREGLIRRFGEEFYNELDEVARQLNEESLP